MVMEGGTMENAYEHENKRRAEKQIKIIKGAL